MREKRWPRRPAPLQAGAIPHPFCPSPQIPDLDSALYTHNMFAMYTLSDRLSLWMQGGETALLSPWPEQEEAAPSEKKFQIHRPPPNLIFTGTRVVQPPIFPFQTGLINGVFWYGPHPLENVCPIQYVEATIWRGRVTKTVQIQFLRI